MTTNAEVIDWIEAELAMDDGNFRDIDAIIADARSRFGGGDDLAYQQMRVARGLIENFVFTDPTLWPILSEIDTALVRGLPKEHRARRLGGTHAPAPTSSSKGTYA